MENAFELVSLTMSELELRRELKVINGLGLIIAISQTTRTHVHVCTLIKSVLFTITLQHPVNKMLPDQ